MNLARAIDAIPVVQTTAQRAADFPAPLPDQRVQNKQTGTIDRWDVATGAWIQEFFTLLSFPILVLPALTVTGGSTLQGQVTVANGPVIIGTDPGGAGPGILRVGPNTWEKIQLGGSGLAALGHIGHDGNGLNLATNAWWTGGQWQRDDQTKDSMVLIQHLSGRSWQFRIGATFAGNQILTFYIPLTISCVDASITFGGPGSVTIAGGLNINGVNHLGFDGAMTSFRGINMDSPTLLGGATNQTGIFSGAQCGTDAVELRGFGVACRTPTAAFVLGSAQALRIFVPTLGVGSSITTYYGILIDGANQATTNYGIWVNQSNGAGNAIIVQQIANTVGDCILVSGGSLTGATAKSLVNLAQTWNTSGAPAAILLNITNTGSGAGARLVDLQVAAASKFSVDVNGIVRIQNVQVLGARKTGWVQWTGTATRTSFATGTATLQNVAEALKALLDDLGLGATTHGLIGV